MEDLVIDSSVMLICVLILIITAYPFYYSIILSLNDGRDALRGGIYLWPRTFSLENYRAVFRIDYIYTAAIVSVMRTVIGTVCTLFFTGLFAYSLSHRNLRFRRFYMVAMIFTMYFSGGMIPTYMLIMNLKMLNTPWALIIPGSIGVYNMIIAKTFIQNSIPPEMLDAAKIDGCSDFYYYVKVVIPLSKAIIAVLVLFYGVGHWNAYFNAMIYLHNRSLYPLTIILREILMASQIDPSSVTDPELQARLAEAAAVIKYALIVVTVVPVIVIYPFVQKYFVKGVMIGSLKG